MIPSIGPVEPNVDIKRHPIVTHDPKTYSITGILDVINDPSDMVMCLEKPDTFRGTIIKRAYDQKLMNCVIGILVNAPNGPRTYINIDETLYDRLDRVDSAWLDSYLSEGSRHVFSVRMCGASGSFLYLDSVK